MSIVVSLASRSLLLALETLALSLPLGTIAAWLLLRSDLPGRKVIGSIIAVLLFIPLFLQASAWQAGFGMEGWYAVASGEPWLTGWNAAVWVHVLAAIPWIVLFAGLGLRIVEPALEESALSTAELWQVFFHVTLPSCWPALGLAAIWATMYTAGEMTVTSIFSVPTYAEEVDAQIATHDETAGAVNFPVAGHLGHLVLLGLGMYLLRATCSCPTAAEHEVGPRFPLGRWRWPLALAVVIGMLLLAGVPLANLVYKAGVLVVQTDTGRVRTWSAGKCLRIIIKSPWKFRFECEWSLASAVWPPQRRSWPPSPWLGSPERRACWEGWPSPRAWSVLSCRALFWPWQLSAC